MTTIGGYTIRSARIEAQRGNLRAWVSDYLNSHFIETFGPHYLSVELPETCRFRGPLKVELGALTRTTGPEPHMRRIIPEDVWEKRIARQISLLDNVTDPPPLIADYRAGNLLIRNTDCLAEAMCRLGWQDAWVIICYWSDSDYAKHNLARWMI